MADIPHAPARLAWLRLSPLMLVLLLAVPALAASLLNLSLHLPPALWWQTLSGADLDDARQILVLYSFAPRLTVSLLAGGALGLAGGLLQQILRNPIASPTTLGIEAGASVALAAALVWMPALIGFGREWVALGGGLLAIAAVLALARRSGFAPLVVILAGMVTGLACAAMAALLALFNSHYLAGLFLWGAGSLSQQDWSVPSFLAPRLALAGLAAMLLLRPLTLLGLDDGAARSLGLSLAAARLAALAVAVALTAFVVAGVGSIGFIGLAAPVL
ncbi:MAG: Fe3+-hydroxamate ABC transporter permease FhuB, partial [Azorhizobium sp. 32-67-21]